MFRQTSLKEIVSLHICDYLPCDLLLAYTQLTRSETHRHTHILKHKHSQVSPIDHAPCSFIPVLFGHAEADTFVLMRHSESLHAAYAGDKNLIK